MGGGWDTLDHWLITHCDAAVPQSISPSDLLPSSTRPQPTESRTKESPTKSISPQLPPLRRAVSITPVSRRSSTSSDHEPWAGNLSSGDSGCGSCESPRREGQLLVVSTKKRGPRRSSLCGPSPPSQAVIGEGRLSLSSRRSLITESGGKLKPINRSTLGLNNVNGHEVSANSTSKSNKDLSSRIPTPKRYINYLSSSQHIKPPTAKSSSPSLVNSKLRRGGSSSSLIPSLISDHSFNHDSEDGKTELNNQTRRSSLKAF